MATVAPPPSKRQKVAAESRRQEELESNKIPPGLGSVRVQFVDQSTDSPTGGPVSVPLAQANVKNLELLLNSLQGQHDDSKDDRVPYRFSYQSDGNASSAIDVISDLYSSIIRPNLKSPEDLITLRYTPQSVFRVRAVSRCSATISGHGQAILATQFSPQTSSRMVSGSGDGTARIWDCDTGTPFHTLKGHTSWVLAVAYSPDGSTIATGSMDNTVRLWEAASGQALLSGKPLRGHTKWITSLSWEPIHLQQIGRPRLASSSKDATVRIWDCVTGRADVVLSRQRSTISCVKWSGSGRLYTASHDKTVGVFSSDNGRCLKVLTAHAHWVNHLALSTDAVLRTGYYNPEDTVRGLESPINDAEKHARAQQRYRKAITRAGGPQGAERLVTASDDCTIYLWDTSSLERPVARLHGHQKQVNQVTFSPDGRLIASCGFDNCVKVWRARDGSFITTLRGHVGPVYMCVFSGDSRMLCSASKDTTVKIWDMRDGTSMGKMVEDLSGSRDEVFAVDWSVDGRRVGSGGKDKMIRVWTS